MPPTKDSGGRVRKVKAERMTFVGDKEAINPHHAPSLVIVKVCVTDRGHLDLALVCALNPTKR